MYVNGKKISQGLYDMMYGTFGEPKVDTDYDKYEPVFLFEKNENYGKNPTF